MACVPHIRLGHAVPREKPFDVGFVVAPFRFYFVFAAHFGYVSAPDAFFPGGFDVHHGRTSQPRFELAHIQAAGVYKESAEQVAHLRGE